MTREQLLMDLLSKGWVDGLVTRPELKEEKPNGDKWYSVNVREIVGNSASYRNIHFYVVAEGTKEEAAYYKDSEPQQTIATELTEE